MSYQASETSLLNNSVHRYDYNSTLTIASTSGGMRASRAQSCFFDEKYLLGTLGQMTDLQRPNSWCIYLLDCKVLGYRLCSVTPLAKEIAFSLIKYRILIKLF